MVNIVCAYKKSPVYTDTWVYRLKRQLDRNITIPFNFHCLTKENLDCSVIKTAHDWSDWWIKMELFRPDIDFDFLYIDLDTLILNNINDIIQNRESLMLKDFYFPHRLASGVMYIDKKVKSDIWHNWIKDPEKNIKSTSTGDQEFIERYWPNKNTWQDKFPNRFASYKIHCKDKPSESASFVCFHGKPKPTDLNNWVSNYWR